MAWISHPIIRTFDKICLSFLLHPNSTYDKDTLRCRQEGSIHKNRLHMSLKFVLKIQSTQSKCWYVFVKIKRQHVSIWAYGNIGWTFVTRMLIGSVCNNPPILPLYYSAWSVTREIYIYLGRSRYDRHFWPGYKLHRDEHPGFYRLITLSGRYKLSLSDRLQSKTGQHHEHTHKDETMAKWRPGRSRDDVIRCGFYGSRPGNMLHHLIGKPIQCFWGQRRNLLP